MDEAIELCGLLRVYQVAVVERLTAAWIDPIAACELIVRWHDGDGEPPKGVTLPPMGKFWRLRAALLKAEARRDAALHARAGLRVIAGGVQ